MVKKTKLPKFQNLPTLADLAKRRRQSVTALLAEWDIHDVLSLERRLVREGLAPEEDGKIAALFAKTIDAVIVETVISIPAIDPVKVEVSVEQTKKIQKQTESDNKKLTKTKFSLDASKLGTENRVTNESVTVVSDEAKKSSNET